MKTLMPDGEFRDIKIPQFKTPYNHDTNDESDRTATYFADPSLTKQEFKDDSDMNKIIDRFLKNNEPPPMPLPEHFVDTTTATSYYEMSTRVAEANADFYSLNANKRAEFQNDPTRWADAVMAALQNDDRQRLRHLGIDAPDAPQETLRGDPPSGDSPAPKSAPETPAELQQGETPATPKSDKGK